MFEHSFGQKHPFLVKRKKESLFLILILELGLYELPNTSSNLAVKNCFTHHIIRAYLFGSFA